MSNIAVRADGLGKKYRIGLAQQRSRYGSLRESLASAARSSLHWLRPSQRVTTPSEFWALRDISFELEHGEVLGIIGRNGAGKSTLLKLLSRITEPTEGRAEIHGRVGSLLEVGTGFHPELTGRENIFLNGAILGMSQAEVRRKFDEIVDFAEIERFIDTPVKRYSSGMYMRLAFSVAAHLEPEVLVVDEVLAVGDATFQEKCLGKMGEVASSGRTVLFVSHNLGAVKRLCKSALLLSEGRLLAHTDVDDAINRYVASRRQVLSEPIPASMRYISSSRIEVFKLELLDINGFPTRSVTVGETLRFRLWYRIGDANGRYKLGLVFRSNQGHRIATINNTDHGRPYTEGEAGSDYSVDVVLENILVVGTYVIDINVKDSFGNYVDAVQGIQFSVEQGPVDDNSRYGSDFVRFNATWSPPTAGPGDESGASTALTSPSVAW